MLDIIPIMEQPDKAGISIINLKSQILQERF